VRHPQLATRLAAVVAIVIGTILAVATPASAHARLQSSDPKNGSTVKEALSDIKLVFSEEINSRFATVVVTGPDDEKVADGKPEVDGRILTQRLKPDLANGGYRIAFRVVSADGHPIGEELRFTLEAPAPEATPETTADATPPAAVSAPETAPVSSANPAAAAAADDEGNSGAPTVLIVIGTVAVLGVLITLVLRRRRQPSA
jgi:copper resistance protein C